jgi:nucleotide-binding universal stress UspA family protein
MAATETLPTRRRRRSAEPGHRRKFLVVVDDTPECDRAIYYASRRAQSTAGVLVLLAVTDPPDGQTWRGVEEMMRKEAQDAAAASLEAAAARARAVSGIEPERVMREGERADEIRAVIQSDEDVAVLVLAAAAGRDGPGPLVTTLAGAASGTFAVPITIVPGDLSDAEIDALA